MQPMKLFVINVFGNPVTEKLFSGFLCIQARKGYGSSLALIPNTGAANGFLVFGQESLVIPLLKLFPCPYHKIESDPE